jgi:hypothetical protein
MIQDKVDSLALRLLRMLGRATLTMVASTKAMKNPASRTASANHDERGAGAKCGRAWWAADAPVGCAAEFAAGV